MSTRHIAAHLAEVYGTGVSAATISRVTDVMVDEIAAWQSRPVDPGYPILYIDAIVDQGPRRRSGGPQGRAPGRRRGSGGPQAGPRCLDPADRGREVWSGVLTELRNRGLKDGRPVRLL